MKELEQKTFRALQAYFSQVMAQMLMEWDETIAKKRQPTDH